MYIAINKKNPLDFHSFTWTADSKLIINGKEEDEKNWEIVEVSIVKA